LLFQDALVFDEMQDRIIRLEERLAYPTCFLRYRPRIGELDERTVDRMRFASDAELPRWQSVRWTKSFSRADIKKVIVNCARTIARVSAAQMVPTAS